MFPDKSQIKFHEGLRLKCYKDSMGYWTIGYGHFLGSTPNPKVISIATASKLLELDIAECIEKVSLLSFWHNLSDHKRNVLLDMCFNLGFSKLKTFSKMLEAAKSGDNREFRRQMFWTLKGGRRIRTAYSRQVGKRAIRLALMWKHDCSFSEVRQRWMFL